MSQITEYLITIRRILKCQETILKEISVEYALTLTEATIISFLHNNPGRDTAADIVELRMLSKGHVSQAVESLIQKSLLLRRQDTADRRKIHLSLTPASPLCRPLTGAGSSFMKKSFGGCPRRINSPWYGSTGR